MKNEIKAMLRIEIPETWISGDLKNSFPELYAQSNLEEIKILDYSDEIAIIVQSKWKTEKTEVKTEVGSKCFFKKFSKNNC